MGNSIKAIAGGVGYVVYYLGSLARALCVPFVLIILLNSVPLMPNVSQGTVNLAFLAQWIPLILVAITTHRIVLEGPNSVPAWGLNRFGLREVKFFLYQFVVALVALPAVVFISIPYLGIFIAIFVFVYVVARLSLVFPGIALDKPITLKASWNATKSHQLMMLVVVVAFPAFLGFIDYLLGKIPGTRWILVIFSTVTTVFVISALSVAYKIIVETGESRYPEAKA